MQCKNSRTLLSWATFLLGGAAQGQIDKKDSNFFPHRSFPDVASSSLLLTLYSNLILIAGNFNVIKPTKEIMSVEANGQNYELLLPLHMLSQIKVWD